MNHRWRLTVSTARAALGPAGPVPAGNTSQPETTPALSRAPVTTVPPSRQNALDRTGENGAPRS